MKIKVDLKQAAIVERETLTTGSRGIMISVEFSPEWDGLAKTAQFYDGTNLIPIIMLSDFILMPWEMTSIEGNKPAVVFIGKQDGEVKASVECPLGTVWYGIRDGLYPPEPPTPDWIAQVEEAINQNRDGIVRNAEEIANRIPAAEKGQPNGVATLGEDGKVPASQLPDVGVAKKYVDEQDAATLEAAKAYSDDKLVTIEIEDRGGQNFWTRPVTTANEIIDMVNAGKEVRLSFYDTITNTGDQIYPYENTRKGVCYFRRNVITAQTVSRISWGVQYNGSIAATEISYVPPAMTSYATCNAEAAPPKTVPVTWYVSKDMSKPSGNVGMMIDVFWKNGRADGIGYDISLVWGSEGSSDNEVIVPTAPTSDSLTGQYSIPTEGTVRYQLIEQSGRKRWQYVSGKLLSKSFSSDTAAEIADKNVHGMEIAYLPGMEIYVQLDAGNTADVMRLVPDTGKTLPVYGNGIGAKTGAIPAGYILHLKNAGDHWQIINGNADAVSYGPQALTAEQQEQARKNIGLGEKWELIDTIIGDGVTEVTRLSEEPDGTPYDFTAVHLKFKSTDDVERSINYSLYSVNDTSKFIGSFYFTIGNTQKFADGEHKIQMGYWNSGILCFSSASPEAYGVVRYGGQNRMMNADASYHVTRIDFNAVVNPKTQVEIWAVRA